MNNHYHIVTINRDEMEYVRTCPSIEDVINEFIRADDVACDWMLDTIDVSSDGKFAYCQGEDNYNERIFIREISEAEADFLLGEWSGYVDA